MRITADGVFDVTFEEDSPMFTGDGFFSIANSTITDLELSMVGFAKISDFQFSMLGFTWDEADTSPAFVQVIDGRLNFISIPMADEQGSALLAWDFHQGIFGIALNTPGLALIGTSEDGGPATGAFSSFESFTVAEPGTALLLALALLGAYIIPITSRTAL